MKVSSYSPKNFDHLDLVITGNLLFTAGLTLFLIFLICYFIILPFNCILFPATSSSSDPTSMGFGMSTCSFNWMNPSASNKCNGLPPFPIFFVLSVFVLVFGSFVIHNYAKR